MANGSAPGAKGGATRRPMTRGAVAISVSFAATGSGCAAATGKEAEAAAAVAAAAGTAEDTDDGERGRAASPFARHGVAGPSTVPETPLPTPS